MPKPLSDLVQGYRSSAATRTTAEGTPFSPRYIRASRPLVGFIEPFAPTLFGSGLAAWELAKSNLLSLNFVNSAIGAAGFGHAVIEGARDEIASFAESTLEEGLDLVQSFQGADLSAQRAEEKRAAAELSGQKSGNLNQEDRFNAPLPFQFFPETIQDTRTVDLPETSILSFSDKFMLGYQPSTREISFTLRFAQERWALPGGALVDWDKYNFDVAVSLQAMRSFTYPIGTFDSGGLNSTVGVGFLAQPVRLFLPGTRIGILTDYIIGIMRQYSITYKAFFPDGTPRVADMEVSFVETPLIRETRPQGFTRASFSGPVQRYSESAAGPRALGQDSSEVAFFTRTTNVAGVVGADHARAQTR